MVVVLASALTLTARTVEDYNGGWEFSRDKETWRAVTVPHDWAVERGFDPVLPARSGMLPWKGVGYYRKTLVLDRKPQGRVFVRFDGVQGQGTLYVNGQVAGHGDYGYLGFLADLTPYVEPGTNTLVVKADTTSLSSRWYPGAGMYRNVRMIRTDSVYLPEEELFFRADEVSAERALAKVSGLVRNYGGTAAAGEVSVKLVDRAGRTVAAAKSAVKAEVFADAAFEFALEVVKPELWTMRPGAALYTLEVAYRGETAADGLVRRVGLRSCRLDKDDGFFLNGERVQLYGVDLHSDLGPVGMAFNRSLMKRQLEIMRDMGVNALRTSHNPPAPEVLDLCDEMGIFVWDECFDKWTVTAGKTDVPLEDFVERNLERMIRRDRNHPSVIVWSMGNEIPSGGGFAPGQEIWSMKASEGTTRERCTRFYRAMKRVDPTRPVGIGCCFSEAVANGDYEELDFTGWNYGSRYLPMRRKYPGKPIIYSESASAFSVFGCYDVKRLAAKKTDFTGGAVMVDSYDRNSAPWSDIPDLEFERMETDRYVAGEFVWTGIDYLGEPSPYDGDGARSSYFGICDLLAFPKDRFYLYRSYWNRDDFTLHIVPDRWNFDVEKLPVYVYASAAEVELFVNGVSQGRRRLDPKASFKTGYYDVLKRYRFVWESVPYAPGEVVAVAYGADGAELGRKTVRTAGEAARVVLSPESATLPERDETGAPAMAVVKVTLADAKGVTVPGDCRRVAFAAEGALEIVAVANGDPTGKECFKAVASHPLHNGRAGVVIRRTGPGRAALKASAEGVESAVIEF